MLLWMPFSGSIEDIGPNGNVFTNTGVVLGAYNNASNNNVAEFDGNSYLELDSALQLVKRLTDLCILGTDQFKCSTGYYWSELWYRLRFRY